MAWRAPFSWILDRRGAVLIEFAILFPLLAAMLFGTIAYAQHFLLAHSAQQVANDASRAALAGLTGRERREIAERVVVQRMTDLGIVRAGEFSSTLDDRNGVIAVRVRIDARRTAFRALPIIPLPDPIIERSATTLAGGIR